MALKGGSESEQRKKGRKAREVKLQSPRMWHGGGGGSSGSVHASLLPLESGAWAGPAP